MIVAYDLDGVLAVGPPPSEKKWGHMKGGERTIRKATLLHHYSTAPVLFQPTEEKFFVVTARKNDDLVGQVTMDWLDRAFPGRVQGLFMLGEARSIPNVVRFKGEVLKQIGAQQFTEDNAQVLKGLRPLGIELFYFDGLKRSPF